MGARRSLIVILLASATMVWSSGPAPVAAESAPARDAARPTVERPAVEPGGLAGTVVDSEGSGSGGVAVTVRDNSGRLAGFGLTGVAGDFLVADLAPGEYLVVAESMGDRGVIVDRGATRESILVRSGQILPGIEVELVSAAPVESGPPNDERVRPDRIVVDSAAREGDVAGAEGLGSISGTVTSDGVSGVLDVLVAACPTVGGFCTSAFTAADGTYLIDGLPIGDYTVEFNPPGGSMYVLEYFDDVTDSFLATAVTVLDEADTPNIDAVLELAGSISGTVTGAGSVGLDAVDVFACPILAGFCEFGVTLQDGTYQIDGLLAGDYEVSFTPPFGSSYLPEVYDDLAFYPGTPVTVTAGVVTSSIDAELALGGSISGTVTGAGGAGGLVDVNVQVCSVSAGCGFATTEADGTYQIDGLAADDYEVLFSVPFGSSFIGEFYDDLPFPPGTPVTVTAGVVTSSIDAELALGGSISGTVIGAGGAGGLVDVSVVACPQLSGNCGFATTAGDGTYQIDGLEGGDYEVQFSPAFGSSFVGEYYDDTPDFSSATPVAVVAGVVTSPIDAELAPGGSIAGTVTGAGGIGGLDQVFVQACSAVSCGSASTAVDGTYQVDGLMAGDHTVTFSPPFGSGYQLEYFDDVTDFSLASPVTVTPGVVTSPIDAELAIIPLAAADDQFDVGPKEGTIVLDVLANDTGFTSIGSFDAVSVGGGAVDCAVGFGCEYDPPEPYVTDSFTYTITNGTTDATATVDIAFVDCIDPTPAFASSGLVAGYEWLECPGVEANAVVNTSPTTIMPVDADGGLLLTSGHAALAEGPNDSTGETFGWNTTTRGANDVSILRLDLEIPAATQCLSFDFVFGSEEFPEFVGSFNDAFLAELGTTSWSVSGNDITSPDNFAFDALGGVVGVNSSFFDAGLVIEDGGWEYDGSTSRLIANAPVAEGPTSLFLSIFDANDWVLDSGVLIDALRTSSLPCTEGANVPPVAEDDVATATAGVPVDIDVLANDFDPDGALVTISANDAMSFEGATVVCAPAGPCTYTAPAGFEGPDSFDYTIVDAGGATDSATVSIDVSAAPAVSWPDFDGDGAADRSVWRPSVGGWYVDAQATAFLGLDGDVPVPEDYDGDSETERAVFRDGAWFIEGEATRFLGAAGDVPVPGDYDGDGSTEVGVYRDGAWFVEGETTVFLGGPGDIPIPADYDGDGSIERAVYRPSVGGWYVEGQAPVFFGLSSDVPVPADYDGDGAADRAVYRPSVGGWYVEGQAPVFIGLSSDVPVPADYNGDGTVERAVFRPAFGGWYVDGVAPLFYGLGSDLPLPLRASIYDSFYSPV